jgi:hypothetical protein
MYRSSAVSSDRWTSRCAGKLAHSTSVRATIVAPARVTFFTTGLDATGLDANGQCAWQAAGLDLLDEAKVFAVADDTTAAFPVNLHL